MDLPSYLFLGLPIINFRDIKMKIEVNQQCAGWPGSILLVATTHQFWFRQAEGLSCYKKQKIFSTKLESFQMRIISIIMLECLHMKKKCQAKIQERSIDKYKLFEESKKQL
jgi:hypothetical protein